MPAIVKYFWFLCAAFMLANIIVCRTRLIALTERGVATRAEVDRFVLWLTGGLVGLSLVFGVVGLVAGWSSPFCAGMLSFASMAQALVSLVTIASWVAILWWVWRGGGDELLARILPALDRRWSSGRRITAASVRLYLTFIVAASGVGGAIAWRAMPIPPELACPRNGNVE